MNFPKKLIPDPIKQLIGRALSRLQFEIRLRRATPVLVYQMGKVGSTSIYRSLHEQYRGAVLHAHNFRSNHEDPLNRRLYRRTLCKNFPLKVISLTREPIGRNVSAFFQNFERDTGVSYSKASFSIQELENLFLSNYPHNTVLEWFDLNILANFGIDVYASPFPENGIATYAKDNVSLLVMRVEISDSDKIDAVRHFLGMDRFQLVNKNIGSQKEYAKTYKDFKKAVVLPSEYLEKMCRSKYFNHFYSAETIQKAKEAWSRKKS